MSVYVVTLCDPYQDHFIGVFASRSAAEEYISNTQVEVGEEYFISKELLKG